MLRRGKTILVVLSLFVAGGLWFCWPSRPETGTANAGGTVGRGGDGDLASQDPGGVDGPSAAAGRVYERPSDEEIRDRLTSLQYDVTQREATERPFDNAYWDNSADGIYVDIVTGEPLFSSQDKYKSGTGWPSFTRPLVPHHIVERDDFGWLGRRTEVHSRYGRSHLGHVFPDGPEPTGLRYCINSAALRFVPADQLDEAGYPEFSTLFQGGSGTGETPESVAP